MRIASNSIFSKLSLLIQLFGQNARDMLPIVLIVAAFQLLVIQQPFFNTGRVVGGALLVLLGLTLFIRGMTMSLFPLGESLMGVLVERANIWLLLIFAFCIGFASTVAEPALIAVTDQAAIAAYSDAGQTEVQHQAMLLRLTCSVAVGIAVLVGALCIVKGWRISRLVLMGYGLAAALAATGDQSLNAVAFDAGAAATSAINIPLISATGVGLATMIRGRNQITDGFGLVALCSVMPALGVLIHTSFSI